MKQEISLFSLRHPRLRGDDGKKIGMTKKTTDDRGIEKRREVEREKEHHHHNKISRHESLDI
jgi:hypothetical protein